MTRFVVGGSRVSVQAKSYGLLLSAKLGVEIGIKGNCIVAIKGFFAARCTRAHWWQCCPQGMRSRGRRRGGSSLGGGYEATTNYIILCYV